MKIIDMVLVFVIAVLGFSYGIYEIKRHEANGKESQPVITETVVAESDVNYDTIPTAEIYYIDEYRDCVIYPLAIGYTIEVGAGPADGRVGQTIILTDYNGITTMKYHKPCRNGRNYKVIQNPYERNGK